MAVCYNKNTAEYKALQSKFNNPIITDGIISKWQKSNKSDLIPTLVQVDTFLNQEKALFSLKKREYSEAVLRNLYDKGLISQWNGEWYINTTDRTNKQYGKPESNRRNANINRLKVERTLDFWNIPLETVSIERTENTYRISINENVFTPKDIIAQDDTKNHTHVLDIVQHMSSMFPQLNIQVVTVKEAKEYWDSLSPEQKRGVKFSEVKSYYVGGNAVLIKGRVTPETAIEEVLHPFVDAVYLEKKELFNGILKESKTMFPELTMRINSEYTSRKGFTQRDRDLELVTQALSRHFKKEYENEPTESWRSKMAQLLKFLLDVIQDISTFISGNRLKIQAKNLSSNNNLSSIAKLLNTGDLEFKFTKESILDRKVKYSLTPKLKTAVKNLKSQTTTSIQDQIIDKLFHASVENKKETFEDFTVGSTLTGTDTQLVVLDKKSHKYWNIETGEEYGSVTTKIKGGLKDPELLYKLNRDIGNDFDAIMEHITMLKPGDNVIAEDLLPQITVLNKEQVQRAVDQIQTILNMYRNGGAVIVPQVVVSDGNSSTAGTIDLLAIHEDGTLEIIDLKVSKNSIKDDMYDKAWPVNEGSIFYDPDASKKSQFKMSTRMQQSMQVNTYRRMLVNMGYSVRSMGKTVHFHVDVTGKGKSQKFEGTFRLDGEINHPSSQNASFIEQIVPLNEDIQHKESMKEEPYVEGEDAKPQSDVVDDVVYAGLVESVKAQKIKMITRRDALEQLQDREKQSFNTEKLINQLDRAISDINAAMLDGVVDVVYEELLQQAIDEMNEFIKYVQDPATMDTTEYIDRVMNMEDVVKTFAGLDIVPLPEGVSLGHKKESLRNELTNKIREIRGEDALGKEGLIDKGIYNYVRKVYTENTNRTDLTDAEIDKIMSEMGDISVIEFGTGDLATSIDPLSQIMDKLYKRQVQKALDKIELRNDQVRRVGTKLEKLSPNGKVDYSFMLVYDNDNNFTGKYVEEIGYEYDKRWAEIRANLVNEDGTWKDYIYKDNKEDYSPEELEWNRSITKARRAYGAFMNAETKVDGRLVDGEFHKYTKEFKEVRDQVAVWVAQGKNGYWKRKPSVSRKRYNEFKAKYYESKSVTYANEVDGQPDGTVSQPTSKDFPKRDYVEKRTISRSGIDMRDPKYIKLMNPSPTSSLEQAQKEFYLMYQKFFVDLLEKLPMSVKNQMLGRIPLVRDNTLAAVKREGNLITGLWGKTTRGMKNLFTQTSRQEKVMVDENGHFLDTLPIFYVGTPQSEAALEKIEEEIQLINKQWKDNKIKKEAYDKKKAELIGRRDALQTKPTLNEMSLDMTDNLLRFSSMAENYEVMSEIKNTLAAFMKVIDNRDYSPSGINRLVTKVRGKDKTVGMSTQSNIAKRARKWMHMVYYDNEKKAEGFMDKVSKGLIQLSSLTYVGLNPWGNLNNYAVGRINNAIETIGGRYFEPEAMVRATKLFNSRALPDILKKMGDSSTWGGLTGQGKYKSYIPGSKYEALVNHFRMMDDKADIRESGKTKGKGGFRDAMSWAYLLQDGAEYNVQTKVGIAILMSTQVQKVDDQGNVLDEMSLFDAYQYNNKTGELEIKEGYNTLVKRNGTKVDYTDTQRYDIRNTIRETNKHIHGNYAHVDRTVIQEHWLGNLGMQFHKWVAPAIKARYRKEYYDENLGWVEGRWKSALSFMAFFYKEMGNINKTVKRLNAEYGEERAAVKITGMKRTIAEIGLMLASFATAAILDSLFDDDDDDKTATRKRFENALIYQFNRQGRELLFFWPGLGFREQFYMMKSPIAVTRLMGEMSDVMYKTIGTGKSFAYGWFDEDYDIHKDSDVYYQRGRRKGKLKLAKEWGDIIPLWYAINRFKAYDTMKDFYVK